MNNTHIHAEYLLVKQACKADWTNNLASQAILKLVKVSLGFLRDHCNKIDLVSKVDGKNYFTYGKGQILARPANRALFLSDVSHVQKLWRHWIENRIEVIDFARLTYTVALAPCLAMELFDRQNKKGPATYFECYIGHLFAKSVGVNPTRRARLPVPGKDVLMTMDFLFDMGSSRKKVHVPVKMSTRERVVQAWAHQRLLESAFGAGVYRGIMVVFSETKLDSRTREVIEICVPDQWVAYQFFLSRMDRIYYFDLPKRYEILSTQFPQLLSIKQFGEFFTEKGTVLDS